MSTRVSPDQLGHLERLARTETQLRVICRLASGYGVQASRNDSVVLRLRLREFGWHPVHQAYTRRGGQLLYLAEAIRNVAAWWRTCLQRDPILAAMNLYLMGDVCAAELAAQDLSHMLDVLLAIEWSHSEAVMYSGIAPHTRASSGCPVGLALPHLESRRDVVLTSTQAATLLANNDRRVREYALAAIGRAGVATDN